MNSSIFKVILIGDCRVGKTSFLNYVVGRNVNHKNPITPTIGVEWAPIAIQAHGRSVCVNIWDTSGAEKYKSITSSYYRKCQGAILMFDVTDRKSFLNLRMWIAELRKIVDGKLTKIVLANKIDLTESGERSRQVSEEEMIDFCEDNGLQFRYTSAVTGYNVKESFLAFIEKIDENKLLDTPHNLSDMDPIPNPGIALELKPKPQQTSTCSKCC